MDERVIKTLFIYAGAALAEIGGCFAFWIWLRSGKSALWNIARYRQPDRIRLAPDPDRF
jgi:drug/metabolite transporter superfamily protein YnfA